MNLVKGKPIACLQVMNSSYRSCS